MNEENLTDNKISIACRQAIAEARDNGLLPSNGGHLLLAVSGGLDSIVMMDVFSKLSTELNLKLSVAHVDHGLRPESGTEAEFVRQRADLYAIEYFEIILKPPMPTANVEAWARKERYDFLASVSAQCLANLICTAHHLDDQFETIVMRLFSGRFAKSSQCIEKIGAQRGILRPLLELSKQDLQQYAREHELSYVEDSSNLSEEFLRNKVRKKIVPLLKEVFSESVCSRVIQTNRRVVEDEAFLSSIDSSHTEYKNLPLWRQLESQARNEVPDDFHLISYSDYQRLCACLKHNSSKERVVELGSDIICRIWPDSKCQFERIDEKDVLSETVSLTKLPTSVAVLEDSMEIRIEEIRLTQDSSNLIESDHSNLTYVIAKPEEISTLTIRSRRFGEKLEFRDGSRALKKVFNDTKIPSSRRSKLPLVEISGRVVWIPGVYRSTHYMPDLGFDPKSYRCIRLLYQEC